eukprot:2497002-Rhodomonas_salina.1
MPLRHVRPVSPVFVPARLVDAVYYYIVSRLSLTFDDYSLDIDQQDLGQEQQTFQRTTTSHAKDNEGVGYLCCRNIKTQARKGLGLVGEDKESHNALLPCARLQDFLTHSDSSISKNKLEDAIPPAYGLLQ